jgi:hypothetical protein
VLALTRDGLRFGVFCKADQRRRPGLVVPHAVVMARLAADVIQRKIRGQFRLNPAP